MQLSLRWEKRRNPFKLNSLIRGLRLNKKRAFHAVIGYSDCVFQVMFWAFSQLGCGLYEDGSRQEGVETACNGLPLKLLIYVSCLCLWMLPRDYLWEVERKNGTLFSSCSPWDLESSFKSNQAGRWRKRSDKRVAFNGFRSRFQLPPQRLASTSMIPSLIFLVASHVF